MVAMDPRVPPTPLDLASVHAAVGRAWDDEVLPALADFISIANLSPAFDPDGEGAEDAARAADFVAEWCRGRDLPGMTVEQRELPGRTPIVWCEIPATDGDGTGTGTGERDTVLIYGHLDKQPDMAGWRDGLDPRRAVRDGDRLYGRGGADDGYAVFAALTAIEALRAAGGSHRRIVLLIEASEESGSPDLPAHLTALGDRLGDVSLVIGLDSGAADYARLWVTTSLRGMINARLRVDVLTEGVHSGSAGGVVPSSFRLLRRLLDRVEDPDTGRVLVREAWAPISAERDAAIRATAAAIVGDLAMPGVVDDHTTGRDPEELLRARTAEPSLATIAVDGFPPIDRAGNVLRPFTEVSMAIRLAPGADPAAAAAAFDATLTTDPPPGATVAFTVQAAEAGWSAPPTPGWLQDAVDAASQVAFGTDALAMGEGGTIPFMAMLGERFPEAAFLITGVLGPGSNAHGPNEFLHVPLATAVTTAVAAALDAHAAR